MTEESIFAAAIGIPEPAARQTYLDHACAGNVELRKQLAALVAAHFAPHPDLVPADGTVTAPGYGDTADPDGTHSHQSPAGIAGAVIAGQYKLLQRIGEGGMGEVWMADQTEPVKRRVAVKLIRAERGTSKAVLTRFEAERQAIALMDHPHIAKLLDAGTAANGAPYFVMDLVKGVPLTQFCDEHKLSVPDRLRLFSQICSAVQHAHQKGVIHRDLKPTNILIESHGGKPVPKVIDFGLAKAAGGVQLTDHTLFTGFGAVLGTPLYMAPEQATFDAVDVDTRADIYALGVILYELLTGTTPITRDTIKKAALDQVLKLIREQDAPTPSSRLSGADRAPIVAANRQTEPAKLGRFVKGELDWIVLKALAKDRDRRYETANGFAADVERFLNHEPVLAGPPTAGYRLRKFVQRNRGRVIAVVVVVVAVLLGFAGTGVGLLEAKRQADIAEGKQSELERQTLALVTKQGELEAEQVKLKERTLEAEAARLEAALELHDNQRVLLRQAWDAGETQKLKAALDQMRPKPGKPHLRGWETHYLDRQAHAEIDRVAYNLPTDGNGRVVDFWFPGRVYLEGQLATNRHYVTFTATDLATGKPLTGFTPVRTRSNHPQLFPAGQVVPGVPPRLWTWGQVSTDPAIEDDANRYSTAFPYRDLAVWDGHTGKRITGCARLVPDPELVKAGWRHRFLAMPGDDVCSDPACATTISQLLRDVKASNGRPPGVEARVQLHDLATGQTVRVLDPRPGVVRRARFSFNGKYVVVQHTQKSPTGKEGHHLSVWDSATGKLAWEQDLESAWDGRFSSDGKVIRFYLASHVPNGMPQFYHAISVETGRPLASPGNSFDAVFWPGVPVLTGPMVVVAQNKFEVRDATTGLLLDVVPAASGPSRSNTRFWTNGGGLSVPWQNGSQPIGVTSTYRPPRTDVVALPPDAIAVAKDLWGAIQRSGDEFLVFTRPTGKDGQPGRSLRVVSIDPISGRKKTVELSTAFSPLVSKRSRDNFQTRVGRTVLAVNVEGSEILPPERAGLRVRRKVTNELAVFDRASGREQFSAVLADGVLIEDHQSSGVVFDFSPDETRVVVHDRRRNRLLALNAQSGKQEWAVPLPDEVTWANGQPQFAADGTQIVLLGAEAICVFDVTNGRLVKQTADGPKLLARQQSPPGVEYPRAVDVVSWGVTPDGRTFYHTSAIGGVLTLINTADWAIRHRLGTPRTPAQIADGTTWNWHSVGNRFASFYSGKGVDFKWQVWDVTTGRMVSQIDAANPFAPVEFSADGTRAFVLTNSDVRIIDLTRGREVLTLPLGVQMGESGQLALSADGHELTYTALLPQTGVLFRRVLDARPLTDEELARAKKLDAIRPQVPRPVRPDPLTPPFGPPTTASDYLDMALRHQASQQFKEAEAAYRAAIKLEPDFAVLHRGLAKMLQRPTNNTAGALAEYLETVRLAPDDYESWYEIGVLHEQRGEHQAAAKALRMAVTVDNRPPPAQTAHPSRLLQENSLGYNLREAGELAEAEMVLRAAVKRFGGEQEFVLAASIHPTPATVVSNLIGCLIRQGKVNEAKAECENLVKRLTALIPKDEKAAPLNAAQPLSQMLASTLTDFGWAFLWADRYAEAVEWSDRAIKAWGEYNRKWPPPPGGANPVQSAHTLRAIALNWQDKGKEAVAAIDESIQLLPEAVRAYQRMMRARYVAKTGDHQEAVKQVTVELGLGNTNYWDAALAYSLCVKAAKGNDNLQDMYAKQAVALLRKAFDAGSTTQEYPWKKDHDLDPLRGRDDFKAVLADLEKKLNPPKSEK